MNAVVCPLPQSPCLPTPQPTQPPQPQQPQQLAGVQHQMPITERPAEVFVRGEGAWLWDEQGRRYLDWLQGWAVNALGHCPPVLAQALHAQASTLLTPSPALHNRPALELSQRLCAWTGLHQAWLGSTGAEANEGAIKLARKWGRARRAGAWQIITFDNAFHGRNLATMAASGKPGWDALFAPQVPGFRKARFNDIGSVQALVDDSVVAVMLEPVQGEAGVNPATPAFLQQLRALCDAQGLLLILDEVQTGCGRLGTLFGFEHYGVRPDIVTLGKGLGGGVPISAVLAAEHACVFEHGDQGGTYAGNPLMAAASLAVMDVIAQPDFLLNVQARGAQLQAGLQALSLRHGLGEVRGAGLLWALALGQDQAPAIVREARAQGLLLNAARPHCLRFMPRLNSTAEEVAEGLRRLDGVLHAVSG